MSTESLPASEVVARLQADVRARGFDWFAETVDTFKAGDPHLPVLRVATTWMATTDVVRRAAEAGAQLLITHEPTFWNHLDTRPSGPLEDLVYADKLARLNGMTVWRFHDHNHAGFATDPVLGAFYDRVGWTDRTSGNGLASLTVLQPTTLADVAKHLSGALGTQNVRVIGDPGLLVTSIGLGAHNLDSCLDAAADVVVIGETREWDSFEYYRDARALGLPIALIVLSHAAVETWGSAPLAAWVADVLPELEVVDIQAQEPFVVVEAECDDAATLDRDGSG